MVRISVSREYPIITVRIPPFARIAPQASKAASLPKRSRSGQAPILSAQASPEISRGLDPLRIRGTVGRAPRIASAVGPVQAPTSGRCTAPGSPSMTGPLIGPLPRRCGGCAVRDAGGPCGVQGHGLGTGRRSALAILATWNFWPKEIGVSWSYSGTGIRTS